MTTKNRPDADDSDRLLTLALASGCSYAEAAKRVDVGVSTVSRRMRDYQFRLRVSERRTELIEAGAGRLAEEMVASVHYLASVRDDDEESTALRIKAAAEIVGSALRYRRLDPSPSFRPTLADLDDNLLRL